MREIIHSSTNSNDRGLSLKSSERISRLTGKSACAERVQLAQFERYNQNY